MDNNTKNANNSSSNIKNDANNNELADFLQNEISDEELMERINRIGNGKKVTLEEVNAKRVAKGLLPLSKLKISASHASQEDVESDPESFIDPECLPACKDLWDKNIYTFMVSDELETNSWIEFPIEALSYNNRIIMLDLVAQGKATLTCYHERCVRMDASATGAKGRDELLAMTAQFEMQDVKENLAYKVVQEGYQAKSGEVIAEYAGEIRAFFSEFHYKKHRNYLEWQANRNKCKGKPCRYVEEKDYYLIERASYIMKSIMHDTDLPDFLGTVCIDEIIRTMRRQNSEENM